VQGGLGSVEFNGQNVTLDTDDRLTAIQNSLLSGATGNQQLFNNANSMFAQSGTDIAQSGQQQLGLGQSLLGRASALDTGQVAREQFDKQSALLEPGFQRQRTGLENRLFAQGRLGSSGGAGAQRALSEAQGQTLAGVSANALGQGLAAQNQMFNQGQGLIQQGRSGVGSGAGLFNQQIGNLSSQQALTLGAIQGAQGIDQAAMQAATLGGQLGGRGQAAAQFGAGLQFQANSVSPGAAALAGLSGSLINNPGALSGLFSGPQAAAGGAAQTPTQSPQLFAT
jgi:hypothetical protein